MQKSVESILRTCVVSVCGPTWYFTGHCRYASIWLVRSGDNVIYLGGTVHLLRPSDYPLPDEFDEAYTTLFCLHADCRYGDRNAGRKFKRGLLISLLQILAFQRIGFTPQGVVAFFHTRELGDGKAEWQLETVQEHIGFIAAMGESDESEFILLSLKGLSETGDVIDGMIGASRSGDAEGLSKLFLEE